MKIENSILGLWTLNTNDYMPTWHYSPLSRDYNPELLEIQFNN